MAPSLPRLLLRSLGAAYFAGRTRTGILLLLTLLLAPLHALCGLAGAALTLSFGSLLGLHRVWSESGVLGASGLLSGLALATYLPADWRLFVLLPAACLLVVLLLLALIPSLGKHDLPILALPFVGASWLTIAASRLIGMPPGAAGVDLLLWPPLQSAEGMLAQTLPGFLQDLLHIMGSLLFLPGLLPGLLVLCALLLGSRITALAMLSGGLLAAGLLRLLAGPMTAPSVLGLTGFNTVLVAGALAGIFVALNPRGLLWALLGTLMAILLSAGITILLRPLGLPVLAFPFCVTVLLFLYPLKNGLLLPNRLKVYAPPLYLVGRAEDNLRAFERWQRDSAVALPLLSLPLRGLWTVTQGPGGSVTHNTDTGSEAWDFMLLDEEGHAAQWPGEEVEQYFGYACPVLAPADGIVTAIEGSLPDNRPGTADTSNPWGNWILLTHENGSASLLAHLRPGSLLVTPGQSVTRGQDLAQVGNSGRSPQPHLHLQLNESPWLAAHSLPASFAAWCELDSGGALRFHPSGRPQAGQTVCHPQSLALLDWSPFLPLAVPGLEFSWLCRKDAAKAADEILAQLSTDAAGGLLLTSGESRIRLQWWPDFLQLSAVREGDPAWQGKLPRRDLLDLLPLLLPVLPLRGQTGMLVEQEIHSPLLARGLRRSFALDGKGHLRCRFESKENAVRVESQLEADNGNWHCVCQLTAERWIDSLRISHNNREILALQLKTVHQLNRKDSA